MRRDKKCKSCGEVKPLDDYYKSKLSRDGRSYICKKCHGSKYNKKSGYISPSKLKYLASIKKKKGGRVCDWCGGSMTRKSLGAKVCSKECKNERHAAHKRTKNYRNQTLHEKNCVYCGDEFIAKKSTALYCSRSCNEKHIRDKQDPSRIHRRKAIIFASKKEMDNLVRSNALEAWRYWIKEKAPNEWLNVYYASTDSPWNDHRLSPTERYRMKYRTSTEFAINERMRRQVNKAKKRDGIADVIRRAIKNSRSSPKVERELGYSITELKTHIERQFTRRMTWDAYMKGKIHIDHIIPQKSFDLSIDSEWVACWSMTNLRPMWARDNLMKGGRIENLL